MDGTIQRHLGARNNQSAMRNQLTWHKFPVQSFYYPCWHRRPKNPNISQTCAFQWYPENLLAGAQKITSHFKVYFHTDFEHFTSPSGRSIVTESEVSRRKIPLSLTRPRMIRARWKAGDISHFMLQKGNYRRNPRSLYTNDIRARIDSIKWNPGIINK